MALLPSFPSFALGSCGYCQAGYVNIVYNTVLSNFDESYPSTTEEASDMDWTGQQIEEAQSELLGWMENNSCTCPPDEPDYPYLDPEDYVEPINGD